MPDDLPTQLRRQAATIRSALRTGSDDEKVRDALQITMLAVAHLVDLCAAIEARCAVIEAKLGR